VQSDKLFEAVILSMSHLHPASRITILPGGFQLARLRMSVIAKLHRRLEHADGATASCLRAMLHFIIQDGLQSTRNKGQQPPGDFLGQLEKVLRTTAKTLVTMDGCTMHFVIWGVAIIATVRTVEGLGCPKTSEARPSQNS